MKATPPKTTKLNTLREGLEGTLRKVAQGLVILVTGETGEKVVLLSVSDCTRLLDDSQLNRAIDIGTAELDAGLGIPHAKVLARLKRTMPKWQSAGRLKRHGS